MQILMCPECTTAGRDREREIARHVITTTRCIDAQMHSKVTKATSYRESEIMKLWNKVIDYKLNQMSKQELVQL